jgi:hypothetical protein
MQNIKNILLLAFVCLIIFCGYGQAEVRDEFLLGQKTTLAGLIAGLDVEKKLIRDSYKALAVEEQKWRDKIDVIADPSIMSAYTVVFTNVHITLNNRINSIENKITILEATPPFIHRGLKQIKGDLAREKTYLDRVKDDVTIGSVPGLTPRLSGGQGYSYTWVLKLFLRMKRIKSKLQKIEYRLNNLNVFTKAFY